MSNPTSNFNWQMPTATDLVTDLPADFEVFGQAVDSSMADLLGGTTGQILAKNSNTNMDFVWITNDVGDITAVTAGTGISGGGTSGAVTITNSMATEITAKGDLIVGTGNAAFDNLPAGTDGHVLTADSTVSPTGLKWAAPASADSYTLISSQALTGGTTVSWSSIASTYRKLVLVIEGLSDGGGSAIFLRFNSDTGSNYVLNASLYNGSVTNTGTNSDTFIKLNPGINLESGTSLSSWNIEIPNYASADGYKYCFYYGVFVSDAPTTIPIYGTGGWKSESAINAITLGSNGTNLDGGTAYLYGVK